MAVVQRENDGLSDPGGASSYLAAPMIKTRTWPVVVAGVKDVQLWHLSDLAS